MVEMRGGGRTLTTGMKRMFMAAANHEAWRHDAHYGFTTAWL